MERQSFGKFNSERENWSVKDLGSQEDYKQKIKNKQTIYHVFRSHDKRFSKGSCLNSFHVESRKSNIVADGSQLN